MELNSDRLLLVEGKDEDLFLSALISACQKTPNSGIGTRPSPDSLP